MRFNRGLSLLTSILLASVAVAQDDYISVQYVHYSEDSGRTTIAKPAIEFNKNFGTDYTLNVNLILDTISGASPTFYDASSGASAYSRGSTDASNVTYGDIDYSENRKAGGANLATRFKNRDELTVGFNYSYEQDYKSIELSSEYLHWLGISKNRSISFGVSYQINNILVKCKNSSYCDTDSGASEVADLNVIGSEFSFTQIIDKNSLISTSIFYSSEDGYLSNPYMNVVRYYNTNPTVANEVKPDKRVSYGGTLKYKLLINSNLSLHSDYRYYLDDWDISSHTISNKIFYEYQKKWLFSGGIRYYKQSSAKFYSNKRDFFTDQKYASSDRRVSSFNSIEYKLGAQYHLSREVSLDVGANYYTQKKYFNATYYSLGIKYKF